MIHQLYEALVAEWIARLTFIQPIRVQNLMETVLFFTYILQGGNVAPPVAPGRKGAQRGGHLHSGHLFYRAKVIIVLSEWHPVQKS